MASCLENLDDDESAIQVDLSNAFNNVKRAAFLPLVREHFPHLYNLVGFLYSSKGRLIAGAHVIKSCEGVQQGDPLGPFLFSLVLHVLIRKIEKEFPNLKLNLWYLDDGSLVGKNDEYFKKLFDLSRDSVKCVCAINRTRAKLR
jgi:hypothetical protein